ncbi:MAG: lysylphosphatidylglycerol synthase transmembrane domain-containing protein [Dehalococcoidia bacterium]
MNSAYHDTQAKSTGGIAATSLRHRVINLPNLLAIVIALSLIYVLASLLDFDSGDTWDRLKATRLVWYALAFGSYYLIFPLRALRWRIFLENAGCKMGAGAERISILRLAEISFLGWFVNTITVFRMGALYRCLQLSRGIKTSIALIAGSLFAERILDTVVTFALLLVAAFALLKTPAAPFVGPILLAGLIASVVLAGAAIAMALAGLNAGRILPSRFRSGYVNFRQGTLKSFHRWPWLLTLSLAIWACESVRLLLVIHALGLSVNPSLVLFVAMGASLVTSFPVTPGGLGLVEAGMVGLLATVLTWEEAASVAILDRSVSYLSVVFLGGALFLVRSLWGPMSGGDLRSATIAQPQPEQTPRLD